MAIPTVNAGKMKLEGTCMELALEGERLCKAGDCRGGVQFFESAVDVGTDDLKTLSAIYSQMGNAYFYLQEYGRALEYHRHDLNLARTIGDKLGEAKASGNLGNTLKVLGKFDEAVACCQRHLDISKEITDRIGEARALYNLGNVYHTKGKHAGRSANQDPGEFPPEVKESLQRAATYYESNLSIVQELGDRAAQGRACGNLGNTHYLLGNFAQAIHYHQERLEIAKEFGDKSAERRAYSNLGNANIFLGEFELAAEYYKKTLQIARQLGERALEAQACYSLGNTYTLMRDYHLAIQYHVQHLRIAQELHDRVGESRACWSLGNAHTALGNHQKALQYASKHLEIAKEIGDKTGQVTAQMNLTDLRTILGIASEKILNSSRELESAESSLSVGASEVDYESGDGDRMPRVRRRSMENMQLVKLTPDKIEAAAEKGVRPKPPKVQKAATIATDGLDEASIGSSTVSITSNQSQITTALYEQLPPITDREEFFSFLSRMQSRRLNDQRCSMRVLGTHNFQRTAPELGSTDALDQENFFDLLSRTQSRRIDDQRCSFRGLNEHRNGRPDENKENTGPKSGASSEEFLDMVAGIQGSRMNEQRANLPDFPGLHNSRAVIAPFVSNAPNPNNALDDQFFEMLMRCQGARMEDQRSTLPPENNNPPAPTVPDDDFFSLIQRIQSNRLDEQRVSMPKTGPESRKTMVPPNIEVPESMNVSKALC